MNTWQQDFPLREGGAVIVEWLSLETEEKVIVILGTPHKQRTTNNFRSLGVEPLIIRTSIIRTLDYPNSEADENYWFKVLLHQHL